MEYGPDPEAVRSDNPAAISYAREAMRLGQGAAAPDRRTSYGGDRGQCLEVYLPRRREARGVLLFFHGGAWIDGHLGWLRFMAAPVTARGIAFVPATYRLAPRCKWPAQLDDVRAAFNMLDDFRTSWTGGQPPIAIGGHSAGGHLAALLAVREPDLPIAACLPVSSSFDLRYRDVPPESDAARVYRYLFADPSQDEDASPLAFVRGGLPPFHVTWGDHDFPRVARSSASMVEALGEADCPVSHEILAGADHFQTHIALRDPAHAWFDRLESMLATPSNTTPTGSCS